MRQTNDQGASNNQVCRLEPLEPRLLLSAVQSDDFNYLAMKNSLWQFVNPSGDATVAFNGYDAVISLPAGPSHDMWRGEHLAPRLMQQVDNTDFQVEAKFESHPSGQYAMNGILVQADENDFIRFDFLSTGGSSLNLFTASIANDSPTVRINKGIAAQDTMYMRVNRQGSQWTETYSYDGMNWLTGASFTYAMAITSIGPYAGNSCTSSTNSPAYSATVDYFFNTASPIVPEDGKDPHADTTPPQIQNITAASTTSSINVNFATDELATASIQYGLTTNYEMGTVSQSGGASTAHTIQLSNLQPSATYHYRIIATDAANNVATSADNSAQTAAAPPQIQNITATSDSSNINVSFATDKLATASIQYGLTTNYELGTVSQSGGATTAHTIQLSGLQPSTTYHYRIIATDTANNATTSTDNSTQTAAAPPQIQNITATSDSSNINVSFVTDKLATASIQYGLTTNYELGTVSQSGGASTAHAIQLSNLQPSTTYHYRIIATDTSNNAATSADNSAQTVAAPTPGPQSDDFNYLAMKNSLWQFVNPLGDATLTFNGYDAVISLPAGQGHDMWRGEHNAPRLMQQVNNTDFQVEVKFESHPTGLYAMNGILVQADENNFIRFEFLSTGGSGMSLFVASLANDSPTLRLNQSIAAQDTMYMRVKRQGSQWTQTYSYDGTNWLTGASFTYAMAVASIGPYAGNSGTTSSNAPAYSALVDYFFNTASPIVPEDGKDPRGDTTPPQIQNVATASDSGFIDVTFATDEPATASIQYGLTAKYELGTVSQSGGASTAHTIRLDNLQPLTTYHYRIIATDTSNNAATSADQTARTIAVAPLHIASTSLSSTTTKDGATLTIGYQIYAPSVTTAVLACTLTGPDGKTMQDTAHNKSVSLQRGTNWYYRDFLVDMAPGAATGAFDVKWNISWNAGNTDSYTAGHYLTVSAPISVAVPILMYHKVDDVSYSDDYMTTSMFQSQMSALKAYGYTPLLFSDLEAIRAGTEAKPAKPVLITFDDGYENLLTKAAPILKSLNFVATSFIPTGRIGGTNAWDTVAIAGGEPVINHLTWAEIQTLNAQGFIDFESHTITHPHLTQVSDSQLASELVTSKQTLESYLPGHQVLYFAYPYGDGALDTRVQNALWNAGYFMAVSTIRGVEATSLNKWALNRVYVESHITVNYDPANAGEFFMDKIGDPDVQHPNLSITSWQFIDPTTGLPISSNGLQAGQSVLVRVKAHNSGQTATVMASLSLDDDNSHDTVIYASHSAAQDITRTFNSGADQTFEWTWTVPGGARGGQYQATVVIRDQYYVLGFEDSGWVNGFTVKAPTGPVVTIAATTPNAAEGGGNGVFTVTRTTTLGSLAVNYTVGGTAVNGGDYRSLSGTVTIANGQTSATITVTPTDDSLAELTEYVDITLTAGSGYAVGGAYKATVSIADNDTVGLPSSLTGLWTFDEGAGTTAYDDAGTPQNGSLIGSPTYQSSPLGRCLTFNGTSQYVSVNSATDINPTSSISLACWARSDSANWNATGTFMSKRNAYILGPASTSSTQIQFQLYIGGAWQTLTYTPAADITKWHHYAATYDGSTMRLYVDGGLAASKSQTGSIAADTGVLSIGRDDGQTMYFKGSLDEVRIYKTAITASDVSALAAQTALNVTVAAATPNAAAYSVQPFGLAAGATQYGDSGGTFTTVPGKYLGATYIQAAQGDNHNTARDLLAVTVNKPVMVYIMYDDANPTDPNWLSSQFTDTGDNVVAGKGTFSVYSRAISAGTFTLGPNTDDGLGNNGMYTVLIVPLA